jgi:hypothetical protein
MARRSLLRFAALFAMLAFLLPLAAVAQSCSDCLGSDSPECCPPSCCLCCFHGPSVLTTSIGESRQPGSVDLALGPPNGPSPSSPPRDVFHVPKPAVL